MWNHHGSNKQVPVLPSVCQLTAEGFTQRRLPECLCLTLSFRCTGRLACCTARMSRNNYFLTFTSQPTKNVVSRKPIVSNVTRFFLQSHLRFHTPALLLTESGASERLVLQLYCWWYNAPLWSQWLFQQQHLISLCVCTDQVNNSWGDLLEEAWSCPHTNWGQRITRGHERVTSTG